MKITEFLIKKSLLLNLITAAILIFGISLVVQTNREAFPSISFDTVTVRTMYPGASPETVESYVTTPLEREIKTVSGIEEMRSSSRQSVSTIIIKIQPDLTQNQKTATVNNVQRAVDRVRDLPKEVTDSPLVTEITSGVMPIMEVTLSADFSYEKLHKIASDISDEIEDLPGANPPYLYGFRKKEYWVEIDPKKLETYQVSMSQITDALARENLNYPGGTLKTVKGDYVIRTIGELKTVDELDNLVIRSNYNGIKVHIKDVGKAISTFEDEDIMVRSLSSPSINIIVRKDDAGDIITLVSRVKETIEDYKNKHSLNELKVSYVNDMSVFVKNRLGVLFNNGIVGIILVLISLLIFLSRGIALVAALGMPVAFLGAVIVMNWLGMTINLLTMFALVIVLGMLVDDAIIVAENIWQHYEKGKSPKQATIDGTKEVFWPVTATILTTIAAFSPLLLVSGIFGKFISAIHNVLGAITLPSAQI